MSAPIPDQALAMRIVACGESRSVEALVRRWEELHAQAADLAQLAGIQSEVGDHVGRVLEQGYDDMSDSRRELVWQAIQDIDAVMQPGLTALRTLTARDRDATAPALALWREFFSARNAVLGLVENPSECGALDAA